jgi:hypothetical protein
MKKWIIILALIAVIGVLFLMLCEGHRREVIISGTPVLGEFLFPTHEQAVVVEKPDLPDTLAYLAPLVEETVTGSGTWSPDEAVMPEDTLPVEISIIQGEDDDQWVQVEIAGKPVHWEELKWYEKPEEKSKFHFIPLQITDCSERPLGIGGAYRLIGFVFDTDVSLAGTFDIDLLPAWVAVQGRLSKHIGDSHVSFGLSGGRRFGLEAGPHYGVDVSFDF